MTDREPDGPYVYQPFGSATHPEHDKAGRLWGVGGLHMLTRIDRLTKLEAESIRRTLLKLEAAGHD